MKRGIPQIECEGLGIIRHLIAVRGKARKLSGGKIIRGEAVEQLPHDGKRARIGRKSGVDACRPREPYGQRLFGNRRTDPSLRGVWQSAVVAICDAAEQLSDTRTGALMVLERRNNLDEIIRTGTPMHADVIPEMLGTIFYEGTPLHDGAAIIENGRIKAAGCVLPLSNNLDLGKDMGTRHRACLGIAENSDAIAIVVSEETGIISMAKNGVLIRHFDRQTLYTRLVDEMIPKETTTEKTTVSGWRGQLDRLWKWVSQKEDDAQ